MRIQQSVVVVAGVWRGYIAITPKRAAYSIEEASQILLLPRPPKPTREGTGFGGKNNESLEGLDSLKEMGGVTKAVTRATFKATSQPPSSPTLPQPPQQPQLAEKQYSSHCRRGGATEDKEPARTHSVMLAQTADTLQKSRRWEETQRRDAMLEPIPFKLGSGEVGGEYLLDDEGILWHAPGGENPELAVPRVMIPGVLALVHSTFGIPGVAHISILAQGKYNRPTWSRMCTSMCSRVAAGEGSERAVSE